MYEMCLFTFYIWSILRPAVAVVVSLIFQFLSLGELNFLKPFKKGKIVSTSWKDTFFKNCPKQSICSDFINWAQKHFTYLFCLFCCNALSDFDLPLKKIEALINMRKMLSGKLFDVRGITQPLGYLLRFCRFTTWCNWTNF